MTDAPPALQEFSLEDRYLQTEGEILISGLQAAVRAPLDQLRADRRAGRRTAAFVSGYQGSPLAGYDTELIRHRTVCSDLGLIHRPAVNEELAATAVMGSQQASGFATARFAGVLGVWYGKAPGFDRAADAIRHGNWAGASSAGGVLTLVGDDHECKSSTLPSRSEATIAAVGLPVLAPGSPQEVLDLAVHGIALSRLSGSWVAMKLATPVADGSTLAQVHPDRVSPVLPNLGGWSPSVSGMLVPPASVQRETEVFDARADAVHAYLAANPVNRVLDAPNPWLTIVAAGHTFHQTVAALRGLGLDAQAVREAGIRLVHLGCVYPLDQALIRRAAADVETVLVVEDKQPFVEAAVRDALYRHAHQPVVLGKTDGQGRRLVPLSGALTPDNLAAPLRRVLAVRIGEHRLAPARRTAPINLDLTPVARAAVRTPFFCSGCPHNTSLQVPDGALVGLGIGCHGMVTFADPARVGEPTGITQMGGEGAQWLGIAPFVDDTHLIQNIGDGTFFHSGQLAVQFAVAAGAHITYKLLYNDAVAMTGGQIAVGGLSIEALVHKLLAEGVARIIVTTDDLQRYRRVRLPAGAEVRDRRQIVEAQRDLRATHGVTVLIHDQRCAAELRRDRKRGRAADPGYRILINDRVCEACGDCGTKSACLSLTSIDTEWGRKTQVDQSSCNLDTTCLDGDCPAFVKVRPGAAPAAPQRAQHPPTNLPEPRPLCEDVTIRLPGIGGTGVITTSQILATAAKLDGRSAHTVDQTGLSQKAGPVVSTLTIGEPGPGVDLVLACDLLVATTAANLAGIEERPALVVGSTTMTPTGGMIGNPTASIDLDACRNMLDAGTTADRNRYVDAGAVTTSLLGDATTANIFLVGIAHQLGAVPLSSVAIERAIELNGAAVTANQAAFRWGRAWALNPSTVTGVARTPQQREAVPATLLPTLTELADDPELHRLTAVRATDLLGYQGRRLSHRYVELVCAAHRADRGAGGDGRFAHTVAIQLHRVSAYKDEYEVARLLLADRQAITERYGADAHVAWQLHPPLFRALGLERKLSLGPWATPILAVLRGGRRLRGTPLDPFGATQVRRAERALAHDYRRLVGEAISLVATDYEAALHRVGLVDVVRGYENTKMANLQRYQMMLGDSAARLVGQTDGTSARWSVPRGRGAKIYAAPDGAPPSD